MPQIYRLDSEVSHFLAFLHNNQLVDVTNIQEDNGVGFKNRFRLQKLIHIAQCKFNLPSGYFYSIYKHGPYSPSLTSDVYDLDVCSVQDADLMEYELDDIEDKIDVHTRYKLPANFDDNRFTSLLSDKDDKWLEIASTLILAYDNKFHEKVKTIEYTSGVKPSYPKDYIKDVFSELVREKLILTVKEEMENVVKRAPNLFQALANDDINLIKN